MLPKWHIFIGLIFSLILLYFFKLSITFIILVFLSSILIDVDHYLFYLKKYKNFSLKKAYFWHKNLPRNHKPIMHIFHTIEFHIFVLALSFLFFPFFFVLIGMLFHSIIDLLEMLVIKDLSCREFSMIRYLLSNKKNYLNSH